MVNGVERGRPGAPLSTMETRVALTLCSDDEPTVEATARLLGITHETAKSHVRRIHQKLVCKTKVGIVKHLIREGLMTL